MVREGGILLSEPLANRLGISEPGGTLSLLTPEGWVPFRIAGIYADYISTRGTVRMNLDVYRRLWGDERLNGMALFLPEGADVDAVTSDLRTQLSDFPNVLVNPVQQRHRSPFLITVKECVRRGKHLRRCGRPPRRKV